jgi:hypothetical protein
MPIRQDLKYTRKLVRGQLVCAALAALLAAPADAAPRKKPAFSLRSSDFHVLLRAEGTHDSPLPTAANLARLPNTLNVDVVCSNTATGFRLGWFLSGDIEAAAWIGSEPSVPIPLLDTSKNH